MLASPQRIFIFFSEFPNQHKSFHGRELGRLGLAQPRVLQCSIPVDHTARVDTLWGERPSVVRQVRNIGSVSGHRLLQPLSIARVVFLGQTARCGLSRIAEVLPNPRSNSASSRPEGYMDVPWVACFNQGSSSLALSRMSHALNFS